MFDTIKCDGEVSVEPDAKWVNDGIDLENSMRLLGPLFKFYVLECPVAGLSSKRKSLESYGWTQPWKNPQYLNRKLKDESSNPNLYWSAKRYGDMESQLNASGLGFSGLDMDKLREVAVFYDSKKNQTLSLFAHLRNSIAHGRFTVIKVKREFWFVFEDVKTSQGKGGKSGPSRLTARIVLKNSTLLKWTKLIKAGPKNG